MAKQEPPHEAYQAQVLAELAAKADLYAGKELVSIYFGGGAPSLWRGDCLAGLTSAIAEHFDADLSAVQQIGSHSQPQVEVSLECNPTDCQPAQFAQWQEAGITRLLVGVQATNTQDLLTLGRDHSMGDGKSALARTLDLGFASVGADVILGVPGSKQATSSLLDVLALQPPHISTYELTIEERTPMASMVRSGSLLPEDEDVLADLYIATHELVTSRGYEHYEVSSFAKPGHRSRHNSLYWQGADYLGLGNGAASLLTLPDGGARRWQNHRQVKRYLTTEALQHTEFQDEMGPDAFATERLWLAMRTLDGVPESAQTGREEAFAKLLDEGLLCQQGGRIRPTIRGFLYNNQLIHRLATG